MKKKSGVYIITNEINGNAYIGSAVYIAKRKEKHFRLLDENTHANKHLQNAYKKYGKENFSFGIIEYCDKDSLIEREQFWIDDYRARDIKLYNIRLIAKSNFGLKASEETLRKMSASMKGRIITEEHKRKLSESGKGKHNTLKGRISPMKGRQHTEETKRKLSESSMGRNTWMKGRIFSEETRQKMSEAQIKRHQNN